jgi:hypothetical protein
VITFGYSDLNQAINFIETVKKKITNLNLNLSVDNVKGKIFIELIGPRDLQRLATYTIKDLSKDFFEND